MKKKLVSGLLTICAVTILCAGCADNSPESVEEDANLQDTTAEVSENKDGITGTEHFGTESDNQGDFSTEADSSLGVSKEQIIALKENEALIVGDRNKELTVYTERVNEYDGCEVYLSYGEDTLQVSDYCMGLDSAYVLVEDTEFFYVLVGTLYDNDYRELNLIKIDDTGIRCCDWIGADYANGAPDGVNSFELVSKVDVLGSYTGHKNYSIQNDSFYTADAFYTIENGPQAENPKKLVTTAELTVDRNGEKTILPVGTGIYIVGIDTEGIVNFVTEDQEEGTLHYEPRTEENWAIRINGVSEYELFETLPYTG